MNKNYHVEKEAEKIIEIMDSMENISFDSYFFTRLNANIRAEREHGIRNFRQIMAFSAFMLFLIVLNVISIESYSSRKTTAATVTFSRNDSITQIAKEYSVFQAESSLYTFQKR